MPVRFCTLVSLLASALLSLAGCGDTPASLGITGPGANPAPPGVHDDPTIYAPGVPASGGSYGPGSIPNLSGGQYFNYN